MLTTRPPCKCTATAAKQREFDAAFLRLQERYDRLSFSAYHDLTIEEREALTLLEYDNDTLKRHDQDILRDHALSRGIDLGKDAYKKRAPVVYMTRLLLKLGIVDLEDVFCVYPELRPERRHGAPFRRTGDTW